MKRSKRLAALALCWVPALVVGCDHSQPTTAAQRLNRERPAPAATLPLLRGMVLLHGSIKGGLLLYGIPVRPLVPETTMQPHYRLRVSGQRALRAAAAGDPLVLDGVLDAGGHRAAMVLVDGRLRITGVSLPAKIPRAHPGLAFSPDGARLAFVCGLVPETDICLLNIHSGRWRKLVTGEGPRDRPAFSSDGEDVYYVAAVGGVAAIWRVGLAPGDQPVQQTNLGLSPADLSGPRFLPVPVGPRPMVALGRSLIFDSGDAVVQLNGETARTLAPAGTLVLRGEGGRVALLRQTGQRLLVEQVEP